MKNFKRYLPVALLVALIGGLAFASFPRAWFAQPQESSPQPQTGGPQPDVGETVLVPKKSKPSTSQPGSTGPATVEPQKKPEKINPSEIYTLSTTTNLVNVDVMVVDNNGNPLENLEKKNFQLTDDGVPQAITNFGTGQAPMTVCMVVEFANRWWPFLYIALEYSYQFLDVLQPKDWVALVSFDMNHQILTDFTQDHSEVRAGLDTLRVPGFSEANLYDTLSFVLDRMKDVHGRKAIIAVVSGIDTFSKLNYDQFLKIVKASGTPIYPISILEMITVQDPYGDNMTTLQAKNALNTVALYSGGQAYFPRFEQEVPQDYQQVAERLRRQYSLGFVPTNASRDGRFHKLAIKVVDEEGNPLTIFNQKGKKIKYRIVARDGYYAPKS